MSYVTKMEEVRVGATTYHMRSLLDGNQCPASAATDDSDKPADFDTNGTNWPLFGLLWPAGKQLAEAMDRMDLTGLRILELGCGLAMAGIVAHRKGADVTVSDCHPLTADFLAHNIALNDLPPLRYVEANWSKTYDDLGHFDLIIGSDILYDREHPVMLANFLMRHLKEPSRVMITDPGRQNYRRFSKEMLARNFTCTTTMSRLSFDEADKAQCRLLDYRRPNELKAPTIA